MMLPLTVQAVLLCEPLLSSPTPDAVTACAKEVNRKMATPPSQLFYSEFVCWKPTDKMLQILLEEICSPQWGEQQHLTPSFRSLLFLRVFRFSSSILGSACPTQGCLSMKVAKDTVFNCFVFSLIWLPPPSFCVCVYVGEGVAMLLIVAGVFLASCSDILASCSELLGPSLLGWVFLICDISTGLAKLRVSPSL